MKYIDLHCDTLTVGASQKVGLACSDGQINFEKLKKSDCAAQCFAIFTEGDCAARDFENYLAFYKREMPKLRHIAAPILNYGDFKHCKDGGKIGVILTVENLGFIGGDLKKIDALKTEGVKMASLVWNSKNQFASPNLVFENGLPQFSKRVEEGLSDLGREAVERLDKNRIIIDVSHLSDGGADEILNNRKIPVVASHSNAQAVVNVSRNLSDGLIKKIADCGGTIGVNFCNDFLGAPAFECAFKHVRHIIDVGGEDVVSLGSDFDGIPVNTDIPDCTYTPALLEYLHSCGLPLETVEKLAYKNFLRVFKEVCG